MHIRQTPMENAEQTVSRPLKISLVQVINPNVKGAMNKHFATKIIPRLQFFLDTSPRYVEHIDELIRKIHEEK